MTDSGPKKPRAAAFARFLQSVGKQHDPLMMLLRAHLYSEAALEGLIRIRIPRGELVNERARLSYHQKLVVVQAVVDLGTPIIATLETLNKVRNEFVHEIDKELTFADVSRIGAPLGSHFEEAKRKTGSDTIMTLKYILAYVCGNLDGNLHALIAKSKLLAIRTRQSPSTHEGKTVKGLGPAEAKVADLKKRGILPKGK